MRSLTSGPEVVAHRGASAHAPEHTLAAYDLALEQGTDRLELDVRATACGALVVVHDPTLLRTAGVDARVDGVRLADVEPAARPLTLDAVLERYGARTRYLVELKDPEPSWAGAVAAAIDRHGLGDRCVAQSFDVPALRRLRTEAPWLACAPLLAGRPLTGRRLDGLARWASGIGVWHRLLTPRVVAAAHARGLAVRGWTVNAPGEIGRLLALGADGVITDVPGVAVALRRPADLPLAA